MTTMDQTPPQQADASPPRPARRAGTIATGLLLLLAVIVLVAAVLPQPPLALWLLGVIGVLGCSLILLVIALLPRPDAAPADA